MTVAGLISVGCRGGRPLYNDRGMYPTPALLAALDEEEVTDARRQSFAQKFLAGAELFDYAEQISLGGIRMQHPEFTEEQIRAEFARRLAIDGDDR